MQQKNPQNTGCRKENPLKTQKSQIPVVFIAAGVSNYFSTKEGCWSSLWEGKKQNKANPQAPPQSMDTLDVADSLHPDFGQCKSIPWD